MKIMIEIFRHMDKTFFINRPPWRFLVKYAIINKFSLSYR